MYIMLRDATQPAWTLLPQVLAWPGWFNSRPCEKVEEVGQEAYCELQRAFMIGDMKVQRYEGARGGRAEVETSE